MLAALKKQRISGRQKCLRRYAGGPQPKVRLVCFPWCGGGASVYRRFASGLPEHIELLAVQLPGREDRFGEDRLLRMEQIIEHVIDEVISVFDRPLVLFGHSMGALVAYELALALKARTGREPDLLVLSGHGAPCKPAPVLNCWHSAGEEEFIANIRNLGGTPPEILEDRQMMRALLPVLRSDYEVLETYKHQPTTSLSCDLVVCAGNEDREVSPETMGWWQQYTTGSSSVQWFEGNHFYLHSQPRILTQSLQEWIAASCGKNGY